MDGDILFTGDIFNLLNFEREGIFSARRETELKRRESDYFNAGVFTTSLSYWRDNQITKKCLGYLENNTDSIYKDQDALNFAFAKLNNPLPIAFNYPSSKFRFFRTSVHKEIIHFVGSIKPWKNYAPSVGATKLWRNEYEKHFGRMKARIATPSDFFKYFYCLVVYILP